MRRILFLTGAIVFVDTMFFAALTPLLPHYVDELGLGKAGAGVLQAMYPAGALVAGIPSGMAAARFGVKPTVLIGLTLLALTTVAFGLADSVWALNVARFLQGCSSAFSWTGALAWLVAASPPGRRGQLIGSAFGAAIAGAPFGPVLGAIASKTGTGPAFAVVAALAIGLAVWAVTTPAATPDEPQPLRMLFRALTVRKIQIGVWLTLLPALLFGNLSVLAPLRLSDLGWGAVAVGGTYLVMAVLEATWAPILGRASDHYGRFPPLRAALRRVGDRQLRAAVARERLDPRRRHRLRRVSRTAASGRLRCRWSPTRRRSFGLEYGYAFALVNIAWAPGQAGGAAIGGALASATSDAVAYLGLSALCVASLRGDCALQRDRSAGRGRAVERVDHARLPNGIVAAQQRLGLTPHRQTEVLDLQRIAVHVLDVDALAVHVEMRIDAAKRLGDDDTPLGPDRLEPRLVRQVERAVELRRARRPRTRARRRSRGRCRSGRCAACRRRAPARRRGAARC